LLRTHAFLALAFASASILECTAGQQLGGPPPDGGYFLPDGAFVPGEAPPKKGDSEGPSSGSGDPPNAVADASHPTLPAGAKRLFVTASAHDGTLGGLTGADQRCALAAEGASLGGKWKALLDGATFADVGPWYLLDGTKVFNNKANVVAGSPLAPPAITEQN